MMIVSRVASARNSAIRMMSSLKGFSENEAAREKMWIDAEVRCMAGLSLHP